MTKSADIHTLAREAIWLAEAAAPESWHASEYLDDGRVGVVTADNRIVVGARPDGADDAAFIAFARAALPALAKYALAAQALAEYSRHDRDCPRCYNDARPCDCGLEDARRALDEAGKETT